MYPLKFKPILKSTLWGGERIIPFKQLDCQQEQVGESWEISDVPGDESVVAEGADAGKNLTQLMEEYKGKLVGEENYKRFHGKFPLLIKFIDAKQDLSIQVHPDDELAMKRHQSMGKTEMWYIIDNTGGQAHLYSGLKKQITPQEYADMIENNTICDALDKYDVQPGDVFFLPAGRIHSIGAGCFLAEIQQTSNITYRIYDFNRRDKNGNLRELHTELSKDALLHRHLRQFHPVVMAANQISDNQKYDDQRSKDKQQTEDDTEDDHNSQRSATKYRTDEIERIIIVV
jgi:mannose-6-phosphate isomerase